MVYGCLRYSVIVYLFLLLLEGLSCKWEIELQNFENLSVGRVVLGTRNTEKSVQSRSNALRVGDLCEQHAGAGGRGAGWIGNDPGGTCSSPAGGSVSAGV